MALSAHVKVFADAAVLVTAAVLLVAPFDGEQETAVAEFLGDGALSSAVASELVHVVHSCLLLLDLDHEELQSVMTS